MALLLDIFLFLIGFFVIYFSVDYLIDMLEDYFENYNISPSVFGFLVLGLDLEESLASIFGAIENLPLLSIGNLIGNSIIAISISFAIPILLISFEIEDIPVFYYGIFVIAALNLFISIFLPQYTFVFGTIGIILFIIALGYSIRYQFNYANTSENQVFVESDDENGFVQQTFFILGILIIVIIGGELLVRSAGNIIGETNISESFFGLIIMAFVTNVEEFWLMYNSIRRDQVELGISAQIGKIFWNISLIFGISGVIIFGYLPDISMIISVFIFLIMILILVYALLQDKLDHKIAVIFLIMLISFFFVNLGLLLI